MINNPIQKMMLQQMLKGSNGADPTQMLQQLFGNDPRIQQAVSLLNGKNSNEEKEAMAKQLCQQMGVNYDDAIKQFKSQFSGLF